MDDFREFVQFIFGPAMFLYTLLMLLMLLYWVIVLIGALDLDFLDGIFGAADGAAEGAAEGAADAVAEGLAEGVAEGAAEGAAEAAAEGAAEGAVEGAAEGTGSALRAVLGFINLGEVPATLILSLLIAFMWIEAYIITCYAPAWMRDWLPPLVFFLAVLAVCFIIAFVLTGITTRPLRRFFRRQTQHGHEHLVGKICRIRSGRVTPSFGQAEMVVGESFLTIDVRAPEEEKLGKRDEAVVVEYHADSDSYEVRKL